MSDLVGKEVDAGDIEKTEISSTKKGLVYIWQGYVGDIKLQSFPIFLTRQIRRVSLGGEHCLFLTSDLEVFSCGGNSHGQLGLGTVDIKQSEEPQIIPDLSDKAVVDVACGRHHSGAVCENGDVFCWGDSSQGQCAVHSEKPVTSPVRVEILTSGEMCEHGVVSPGGKVHVRKMSCGARHTIALSRDGEIWAWGSGIELGLGDVTSSVKPQAVPGTAGRNILDVCCGDNCSMMIVEKSEQDKKRSTRPKQKAAAKNIQSHYPSQCAACSKEIYTYTETNDTCIIDEVHDCQDSMDISGRSMESSGGSIDVDNVSFDNQNISANDSHKNTTSGQTGEGVSSGDSSNLQTISSSKQVPLVDTGVQHSSDTQESKNSMCSDPSHTQEQVSTMSAESTDILSQNQVGSEPGDIESKISEHVQASSDVKYFSSCEQNGQAISEKETQNTESVGDSSEDKNEGAVLEFVTQKNVEQHDGETGRSLEGAVSQDIPECEKSLNKGKVPKHIEAGDQDFGIQKNSSNQIEDKEHCVAVEDKKELDVKMEDEKELSVKTEDKEHCVAIEDKKELDVKMEEEKEFSVKTEDKKELDVKTEDKKELSVQTEDKKELDVKTEDKKELDVKMEDEKELSVKTEDTKELSVKTEDKKELDVKMEDEKELDVKTEGKTNALDSKDKAVLYEESKTDSEQQDDKCKNVESFSTSEQNLPDEVVWRRMDSLEEEAKLKNEEIQRAEAPITTHSTTTDSQSLESEMKPSEQGKNSSLHSTLQSFLPYSSTMLQTMKSMTSHTLTGIQMSVSYVTQKLNTEIVSSSPLTSMSTSLDSLSDTVQESCFVDSRQDSKEGKSEPPRVNEGSPPDREPTPDESRVSKKSQSVKTVWAKQDQLNRKHSRPGDDEKLVLDEGRHVFTDTEVWVWGHNKKGQLGIGDSIERSRPCCIKMLSNRKIIKIAAGSTHSLALTAVGQVYSWGNNAYGQLGHSETAISPVRIKFMKGCHIWDIAAGKSHSIFLADSGGMKPYIFFCGKQPSKDVFSTVVKSMVPIQIPQLKKAGWLRQVSAGGDNCACLLDETSSMVKVLYEFAASERHFFHSMNRIEILFLKPLIKSTFFTTLDVYPFKSSLSELVHTNISLTHHVCKSLTELSFAIRDGLDICQVSQFCNYGETVRLFSKYSQCLADFVAVGGFKYITKTGVSFFEKIQDTFRQLLDDKIDVANHAANFRLAMLQPVLRVKECAKLIHKLSETAQLGSDSAHLLQKVALKWESLKLTSTNELSLADRTCAFWEGANPKLADVLRTAHRRLLRESKTHPLVLPTSGRFSSSCLFLLFNDVFVQSQNAGIHVFPLETLWVEMPESDLNSQTGLVVTTPEETIDLIAASAGGKAEWLMALNSAINKVLANQKSLSSLDYHSSHERLTPPLIRHSTYTFTKHGPYREAMYTGSWLTGKIHGHGQLKWTDGRKYEGRFKHGLQHGYGTMTLPKGGNSVEIHEGNWKDGKLNGHACIRYAMGDSYEGCFKDGQRCGHGVYRQGQHMSSIACIYIGEWQQDKRHGYGVQDDILKGEKYMGMWQEDCRHGKGIVVTLDGMYFEGTFIHNKLSGNGLMLTDDNSCYEGEFQDITQLQGKGTLILPTGDKIEGLFSGSWNEGLKINGTFIKNVESLERKSHHSLETNSKFYSRLSVPADKKWEDIFRHCSLLLGYSGQGKADTAKAWEAVAVMITAGRESLKDLAKTSPSKARQQSLNLENLEVIPPHNSGNLTIEEFSLISSYLHKAFDSSFHPFGKLMDNLVEVFRAAYIGVGAHPRLLFHAVEEVRSYIKRLYEIIRLLFPDLPAGGGPILIFPASSQQQGIPRTTEEAEKFFQCPTQQMEFQETSEIVTQAALLYPLLLPKIYPPLFDLYALYNDKEDEQYWERIMKLNRQGDIALMAYLGVEQKFWLLEEEMFYDKSQKLSDIRGECYSSAVDTLQQIGTSFSPIDKLNVLEETFLQITKTVQDSLKEDHVWCLDDLFPIFQYVVVRAQIRHLGAEIHMIHDLMENHLQYGELGVMATTLKACYFQIQTEKMSLY